ncbi:MAG: TonB-dependent receptor [Pseudomonadota bacterium]
MKLTTSAGSSRLALAYALSTMAIFGETAYAQTDQDIAAEDVEVELDPIIVRSTRTGQEVSEISRSILVLDDEDLEKFLQQTTSVQEILGKTLPGFAPPVTEGSAGSLTLRGRDPLFLIDGVPIAPNTNFSRFLDRFDPLTLGGLEVVYGPTALYGAGATGGVIQFFTQDTKDEPLAVSVGSQIRIFAPDENAFNSDGISTKVNGSVNGRLTDWLSVFAFASFEDVNGIIRSEGDLLTGRSAFANDITFFGKAQIDITDKQSLTATVNRTKLEPSERFFELSLVDAGDGTVIAEETPFPLSYELQPTNEFLYTSLNYRNTDLLGGSLNLLGYFSDGEFLNPGSDIRNLRLSEGGFFPDEWPGLWQTGRTTEEFGFRGEFTRKFFDRLNLSVGFDYNDADSVSLLPISTEAGFDDTLFFDGAIEAEQTPPFTLEAFGIFGQATLDITDRFAVSGGVRWDNFDYVVEGPYEVVFFFPESNAGVRPGGEGSSDDISFNVGATFDIFEKTTLFTNFSQGFTIPSLGFIGNNVAPGVPVSDSELVAPVITDSFEGGIRGAFGPFGYAVAGYFTQSDFSTAVGVDPATGLIIRDRAPVEIYGFELSGDWAVTEKLSFNGYLTFVEGEVDPNDDGNQIALSTQDVPPITFSLNSNYSFSEIFNVFSQFQFVGDRDDGFEAGTDANPVESYGLLDVGFNWTLDADGFYNLGGGVLSFQVTNLLNERFIPAGEASFIPGRIQSGAGRAITISYQHTF